jgi:hypothetical protein
MGVCYKQKHMFIQTWGEVFTTSLYGLWQGFVSFVPSLLLAIIIFIIGWVLAKFIGHFVAKLIDALKLDSALRSLGFDTTLEKAGFSLNAGRFIGEIAKWFIVVVFLVTSFEILGLTQVNEFLSNVLGYLPRVIVASLIILAASLVSQAIKRAIEGGAKAMHASSAHAAGAVAKWAVWVFAIIIALSELGVAPVFMQTFFTGIIAMLAIAGGLAFGLGGKDAAARTIDSVRNQMK